MATKYLGPTFDIHGGGLDLVFPHHENELAQSTAAGDGFARYWFHNGLLTLGGEKMSKSLGNSLLVVELLQRWRPVELRYYLVAAHYRSTMEYSEEAVAEAAAAYRRVERFLHPGGRADRRGAGRDGAGRVRGGHGRRPVGAAGARGRARRGPRGQRRAGGRATRPRWREAYGEVRAMLGVLGVDPLAAPWRDERRVDLDPVVDALVRVALEQRQEARARKDYPAADAIRDRLSAAGIAVEDTPAGPRWTLDRLTGATQPDGRQGSTSGRAPRPQARQQEGRRSSAPAASAGAGSRAAAPTPPAEQRKGHPAAARRPPRPAPRKNAARKPAGRAASRRSCWSAATRWSRRCGRRSRPPRSTSRSASSRTSGSPRPCSGPPTGACRCSRSAGPSSTG